MEAGNNGGNEDNDFPSSQGRGVGGRRYAPVVAHDNDRAVVEMSSLESAAATASSSSSSSPFPSRNPPYLPFLSSLSISFFVNDFNF